jgi:glutamate 5-kinase
MATANQSDGSINHRALLVNARRLVIKVGTGVVCNAENEFDPQQVAALSASIAGLASTGRQVVLVSSGAVTLGAAELGIHRSRLKDASVTRAVCGRGPMQADAGLRGIISSTRHQSRSGAGY